MVIIYFCTNGFLTKNLDEIMKNSVNDSIVEFVREREYGVSSQLIAEKFLCFRNAQDSMAHITVKGILSKDSRCTLGKDNLWHVSALNNPDNPCVSEIPWAVVYMLSSPQKGFYEENIIHISVWAPFGDKQNIYSQWFIDPKTLSLDEQGKLINNNDLTFQDREISLVKLSLILKDKIPVFISYSQQRMLSRMCAYIGEFITDDSMLCSQLMKLNDINIPKPILFNSCYRNIFGNDPVFTSANHYGELFNKCVHELLDRLVEQGINGLKDLEEKEKKLTMKTEWENSIISFEDISNLPMSPGVYGFKDKNGTYIYIGKAKNTRKRLMSYFRNTEESPDKIKKLRHIAYDYIVHQCGSELESLIYEHRLIKKHNPCLNSQREINERKGQFKPLKDCIIVLSHVEKNKKMTFWFRENQKILVKPMHNESDDKENIFAEMENFFYSSRLTPDITDFPEQEIVLRWVNRHKDSLDIIPVFSLSSVEEIYGWFCGI